MTIGFDCGAKNDDMRKDGEAGMETSFAVTNDSAEVVSLLSRVRSVLADAGCADKINAERWLNRWLDTPNAAFDNRRPRSLINEVHVMPRKK
jgi:hypothetical protein